MKINTQRGLTYIETIVTIAIFTIVVGAISSSILFFYRSNTSTLEQAFAISSARKGIEFMVRDIREVAYSDEGSYPIINIATSSFYFYSDTDRDSSIERIRYYIDGTDLIKALTDSTGDPPIYDDMNEVTTVISDNTRNYEQNVDVFTYYDDQGAVITDFSEIDEVAFVSVNLVVNINPLRLPNEFTLRSSATLRNLKTNL